MNQESPDHEPNPYAPPASVETEADATENWRIVINAIYAKAGTTLPKVDLLTGVSAPPLYCKRIRAISMFEMTGKYVRVYFEDNWLNRLDRIFMVADRVLVVALILSLYFGMPLKSPWLREYIWGGFVLLVIFGIRRLAKRKLNVRTSVKRGWLRISPIHPDAITYLRRLKEESAPAGEGGAA